MADSGFKFLAEEFRKKVEGALQRAGLLCRVFSRGKTDESIEVKLSGGEYSIGGKLLQDAVGIRVVLYFQEDITVVDEILKKNFEIDPNPNSSSIDVPVKDRFAVSRYNLIFKFPEEHCDEVRRVVKSRPIDATFEVQIRSVFSEGWHEVEHDLRYKCKEFWLDHDDLSRTLNGIMATLETSEWSMKSLFEDLAYRHYKNKKWIPMLMNRLRIRSVPDLSPELLEYFDDADFAKGMFRIDRRFVILLFSEQRMVAPTLNNAVYIWNLKKNFNLKLVGETPVVIKKSFEDWQKRQTL